ncbi:procathepsin L-like isoform X1 [Carcharodon carcharias]|uniref:procathepsin L-like isoform X1 n=1 Tax=Carcharodon carcharias TaxID=13397 RepID=UPI001B7EE391|nr:procathepsin L-like isoform X1 [Carcharodon carcharias]
MKLSLFLACVLVSTLVVASGHIFDSRLDEDWKNWKSQHEKHYTEEEETYRRMVWEDHVRFIEQHNLEYSMGKQTFTVGMNQFGDMTTNEFNELMNRFLPVEADNSTEDEFDEEDEHVEDEHVEDDDEFDEDEENDDDLGNVIVDWRTKGYVTPVKNQGQCGSCWAFSAVGAIEGQWFHATKKLIPLSEQMLVDCSTYRNRGCQGGWMSYAFEFVINNNGISSAADYSYTARDQNCQNKTDKLVAKIRHYAFIRRRERFLEKAVERIGPISVAIDASGRSFHFYKRGIYRNPRCKSRAVNHAVLVVGFGREDQRNYWLIKNSWGTSWGHEGYIKMAKNVRRNCGITRHAVYPIV